VQTQKLYDNISKYATDAVKDKAVASDKNKVAALKKVAENLKSLKTIMDEQAKLKKQIDGIAALQKDIETLTKTYTAYINDSVKLGKELNKIDPDTKGRDFFFLATVLAGSHPDLELDIPS
jgi:DNA repair exonuclease SbcCD ATPase subunit